MPGKAVGQAAVELPWLCPQTESLIALAEAPARLQDLSAVDPALSLFLYRFAAIEPNSYDFATGALQSPTLPETAAVYLGTTTNGVLPSGSFALGRAQALADLAGQYATAIATATRLAPPTAAGGVARLAPLGCFAVAAIDAFALGDPLAEPIPPGRIAEVQASDWGLDQAAITRRLAVRWRLPAWLGLTLSNLNLPLRVASELVPDRRLFAVVQLAVLEAEHRVGSLGLAHGADRAELLEIVGLDDPGVNTLLETAVLQHPKTINSDLDPNPHRVPLIRNLLRLAAESRRRNGPALVARLEDQLDAHHRALAQLGEQLGERLRDAKLDGLAELAAGAGHEINNPLAIITGNAQRLLRSETDPGRMESLRVVLRQANRIAGILRDLMEFARPPRPVCQATSLNVLFDQVRDELVPLANERNLILEVESPSRDTWVATDPRQFIRALVAIVRNGIEATPAGGRVRVTSSITDSETVSVLVEDTGPGLTPEVARHAFDPFYSGRNAGRGRGLGLSTAWRLVRQNRGDVRYQPTADGRTRFVLTVPRAAEQELVNRRTA